LHDNGVDKAEDVEATEAQCHV